jgi:hypothetical protein
MVWYNPSFKLDAYFERNGLHRLSQLNVSNSDSVLNTAINDKLSIENTLEQWVELVANHSIASQERPGDQEFVNKIENSPKKINSSEILKHIQRTQPEQYEIMFQHLETQPQNPESKKRGRYSSDDEADVVTNRQSRNSQSRRRIIIDDGDQDGGYRRRKRTKKTYRRRKTTRRNKKNKKTHKR